MMEIEYIFLYGTLRKEIAPSEFIHNLLDQFAEYYGTGIMQAKMYNIGSYPGIVPTDNPDHIVIGELYKIKNSKELLNTFDEYEGCSYRFPKPWEYERVKHTVTSKKDGEKIKAWVYIYKRDISGKLQIKSGDYVKYLNSDE